MFGPDKFGWPEDPTSMLVLTSELITLIGDGDGRKFEARVRALGTEGQVKLAYYVIAVSVGINKIGDPVSVGLTLDDRDRLLINSLLNELSAGNSIVHNAAFFVVEHACAERYGDMRAALHSFFNRSDEFGARVMWALVGLVPEMCGSDKALSAYRLRAAFLRLSIAAAIRRLRTHEWCGEDLEAAHALSVLLDDRHVVRPLDDTIDKG